MENYLDAYIEDLLHINEVSRNKLVDLYADPAKTYLLTHAQHADTGMIFVPSIDGRSHVPEEDTNEEDLLMGAQFLLDTVLNELQH